MFACGPPAAMPYCRTVAFGIPLFPFEFPARHDNHSFPFELLQRCENPCGVSNPPSVVIGESPVTIPLSSRNVAAVPNVCESAEFSVTTPPGNQKSPGMYVGAGTA